MVMMKRLSLFVILLFVALLFSCSESVKEDKVKEIKERNKKPHTEIKPDTPILLKYFFEKIPDNKSIILNGEIDIELKIVPNAKDVDKFFVFTADFDFKATMVKIKTGENNDTLFSFKIDELSIDIPDLRVNYQSKYVDKYLNFQIKKINLLVKKVIPVQISEFGVIRIYTPGFFEKYSNLKQKITNEHLEKIRLIISYFFLKYPKEPKKIEEYFYSATPFKANYMIDSLTKNKTSILIIPNGVNKNTDKDTIASFIKGWIMIDKSTGFLKKNFLQLVEKKYIKLNKLKSLVEKKIIINLSITNK
jgi:hypothetical protein